ncbi:MAG: hypothetical protein FP824_04785 [Euryarchaeota archaeon]|nr:hypothetical protein [Euryarchaeota archaeon]
MAVWVILIIVFGGYCTYLANIEPERETVIFITMTRYDIQSMNISDACDAFNQTSFLDNYSVGNFTGTDSRRLKIIPVDNEYIEIQFCRQEEIDQTYFLAIGYADLRPLIGNENYNELGTTLQTELAHVLEYVGIQVSPEELNVISYNRVTPDFISLTAFFGLLASVVTYSFLLFFKKGLILRNLGGSFVDHPRLLIGLAGMFLSAFLGLWELWWMVGVETFSSIGYLALYILPFIGGLYLINREIPKLTQ